MRNNQRFTAILAGLILLIPAAVFAQFQDPVTLSAEAKTSARAGEVVDIIVRAEMDDEWHIYAINDVPEGPIASKISVSGDAVEKSGRVIEQEPIVEWDEGFEMETRFHKGNSEFTVPVLLKDDIEPGLISVTANVLYQVCNVSLCYPPREVEVPAAIKIEEGKPRDGRTELASASPFDQSGNIDLDAAIDAGFFPFILLAISMGFLALLTPCVFPMIPITVSFFIKQGELEGQNPLKQASVYTIGIMGTFTLLGLILAITLGASGANQLAANPWVNLFIASLFIYFALSLFGMYEIQLPQSLSQFTLQQEGRGGYVGTLFMAVTFTLTSFTCTVQFMGLLLVAASQGQWFWPAIGMVVFSGAFALPFFFLALFPQYLANMPQSGSWLNSVKVVMGFLELAAAFKFLSNTDLVWSWGFFTYKMVLASWAIIMLFTGIYLLGKIQLPHDSKVDSLSVPRMILSFMFITFSLYLGTGLFGQKIHGLINSYLPPPLESSIAAGGDKTGFSEVHALGWHKELEDGLAEAQITGQPVFVDFTGYTCTNCRWMETNVFTEKEVIERFQNMVLVHLYTDGGPNYREHQQYEIDRFGTAALPFYVILSPDDEELARFPGMSRNVGDFIEFLDKGLAG
ncbi:MAG: cytochrome c biogenesis protein CcdA [Candidatus Marinimicrobia bacterium]|jgi:thiol:disulfide interchange protein DsbD|nr:cytochrome c biogenesis protein CcdA [Candidatus Neomarinimicrobiota bacterium]MDP6789382.1 cytochrome c biogenesis protein CcdA [Candidatus Neomarinimicrobiota bacterium]